VIGPCTASHGGVCRVGQSGQVRIHDAPPKDQPRSAHVESKTTERRPTRNRYPTDKPRITRTARGNQRPKSSEAMRRKLQSNPHPGGPPLPLSRCGVFRYRRVLSAIERFSVLVRSCPPYTLLLLEFRKVTVKAEIPCSIHHSSRYRPLYRVPWRSTIQARTDLRESSGTTRIAISANHGLTPIRNS